MTLNQLIDLIKELGESHAMIKKIHYGSMLNFLGSNNLYPAVNFDLTGARILKSELSVNFSMFFLDRVIQEEDNETEVLSDQLRIAQDIIAQLRYPGFDFQLSDEIGINFLSDKTPDVLAGVRADISVNLGYISDRCSIPSTYTYAG
jgi:hypothetical protein